MTILVILQTVSCVSVEIEDVTAKQFNAALQTETRIAVFWCKFHRARINENQIILDDLLVCLHCF